MEYTLLPDTEGALTRDNDGAFVFPCAMKDAQEQLEAMKNAWRGRRGRAGSLFDVYRSECWFTPILFLFSTCDLLQHLLVYVMRAPFPLDLGRKSVVQSLDHHLVSTTSLLCCFDLELEVSFGTSLL